MSFKNLDLKKSYISHGEFNIANSLIVPALKEAVYYKRSVGFFSSSVFEVILEGIVGFVRNKGKIQLIASPQLSQDDIDAITIGYQKRDDVIDRAFSTEFYSQISLFDDEKLNILIELIEKNVLDIKLAVTNGIGEYHDKLGIMVDKEDNAIVFYGSANATLNGYKNNYEKVRVVKSWYDSEKESVSDEINEFDLLWSNQNPYVRVYNYQESAKKQILKVISERKTSTQNSEPIELRDYQKEAISAWVNNGYNGFYVMATGTGKTWTAIYSAKELLKNKKAVIVICAPYKHLVKQWAADIELAFRDATVIMASSENPSYDSQIKKAIINNKYGNDKQLIIISTISSFNKDKFKKAIVSCTSERLLIVDEAHRFTDRSENLKSEYVYMLGLSATPFSGKTATKGLELMSFFGGQVYNLPIDVALEKKFLVPYDYKPVYVYATEDEEGSFSYHTQQILSCFKGDVCINQEKLVRSIRNRLRVISMASEKHAKLKTIIGGLNEKDHLVVYCGDGKLFDEKTGEDIKHIQSVKRILTDLEYKASQFTAKENMNERMQLVDAFNRGEISALAAIRCLDEGINIPSIKSALILSSNDDYREFVQRRGRILRKYKANGKEKESATIYDIIVLPSSSLSSWANIELRRFYEYAKLAKNWDELEPELMQLLNEYGLSLELIDVYNFDVEDDIDE